MIAFGAECCWFEYHWRQIFSFWSFRLPPVHHSTVKPITMKSSITFIQSNRSIKLYIISKSWRRYIWVQYSFNKHMCERQSFIYKTVRTTNTATHASKLPNRPQSCYWVLHLEREHVVIERKSNMSHSIRDRGVPASLFSNRPEKHKLGRWCWVFASCQVEICLAVVEKLAKLK